MSMRHDIVLLHGWGMNTAIWQDIASELAKTHRVHLIELPGHGNSPYSGETTLTEWAQACLESAPERSTWIGWSLGGQVALHAARLSPSRVERLVLTASSPRFVQADDWPNAMPLGTLGQFADALKQDCQGTIGRFLALQVRGSDHGREVLRRLKGELNALPEANLAALETGLRLLRSNDLRTELTQLQCPLLGLFGERDTLIPAKVAEDIAKLLPQVQIEHIDGASHAPFLSHTDEWLKHVKRFIQ
jgi:pimeloyl-[acyl-carrier protein] methyl ester esterase